MSRKTEEQFLVLEAELRETRKELDRVKLANEEKIQRLTRCFEEEISVLKKDLHDRNDQMVQLKVQLALAESKLKAATVDRETTACKTFDGILMSHALEKAVDWSFIGGVVRLSEKLSRLHDSQVINCPEKFDNGDFYDEVSTEAKLAHFLTCEEFTIDYLIDEHAGKEGLTRLLDSFSRQIRYCRILRTQTGKAVISYNMPAVEKRLLVRALRYTGEDVVVFDGTGVRALLEHEISTPLKCFTDHSNAPETLSTAIRRI